MGRQSELTTTYSTDTSDPKIMMGKPVITATRVTVESILEALGAGESIKQIQTGHPRLTREAILAAMDFAD
jgi:uncharacterized protein (DUF433 family)